MGLEQRADFWSALQRQFGSKASESEVLTSNFQQNCLHLVVSLAIPVALRRGRSSSPPTILLIVLFRTNLVRNSAVQVAPLNLFIQFTTSQQIPRNPVPGYSTDKLSKSLKKSQLKMKSFFFWRVSFAILEREMCQLQLAQQLLSCPKREA